MRVQSKEGTPLDSLLVCMTESGESCQTVPELLGQRNHTVPARSVRTNALSQKGRVGKL